jgi:hypothetical protein
MQVPILIEPTVSGRFRAQMGEPFQISAEADDAQSALQELVRLVEQRLRSGARLAALTMANGVVQAVTPAFPADDAYKTDWAYKELADAMAENRRQEASVGP